MCGIAGLFSDKIRVADSIAPMTSALWHRGPDAGDVWASPSGTVALGQRRLAILDLSDRGRQPMKSADGKKVISYNGEVYNFQEIRDELEKEFCSFKSHTDTEVILEAYCRWGPEAVHKFNGMWAFIIWDEEKKTLFASRDRVGIKPLYYWFDGNTLLLGSEIKALHATGLPPRAPDLEGMNEYFTFQNIISDRTLSKDIKMLPAGCNLVFDVRRKRLSIERYWDFNFSPDTRLSEQDATELFVNEFEKAVERHLISDVEVGATISGGMDSSAIVSVAARKLPKLKTFTGWFDTSGIEGGDRSYSEREDARIVSRAFNTEHFERLISWQDQIDTLPMIAWHLEDPKVGMCYTFFNISQLVSSHVTVSLSGSGGDEIFAGYPWRYEKIEGLHAQDQFLKEYFSYWSRVIKPEQRASFFTQAARQGMDMETPFREFASIIDRAANLSPVNRALYFEAKTFLHGMLMVEDKTGMAFSIETRFPFLDKNLIEIAQRIPDHLKYKGGQGKYIFRKAFETRLPTEITSKRKQGFTPPDFTWYRRELRDWVRTMLLGRRTVCHEWIEPREIERILARHDAGHDERFPIWSMLFFEGWCRTFLNNNPRTSFTLW